MEISKKHHGKILPPINHYKFQSTLLKVLHEYILKKRISNLPQELKRYIFDYLKLEFIYDDFVKKIDSLPCIKLDYTVLRPILPYIFAFPSLTDLCLAKIHKFKYVYNLQKKNGNKSFIKLKKGNDFALTLLCCLYK